MYPLDRALSMAFNMAIRKLREPFLEDDDNSTSKNTTSTSVTAINGKVVDETGNAIPGAVIYLRIKKFVLAKPLNGFPDAVIKKTNLGKLPIGQYSVLERKIDDDKDLEFVKLNCQDVDSISEDNAWILAREKTTDYAGDAYVKINVSANSSSDGRFSLNATENEDYKLLCVKDGYYDGRAQVNSETDAVVSTASECQIKMEAVTGAIDESKIINNLQYFDGFGYRFDPAWFPKEFTFPGYKVKYPKNNNDKFTNCSTFSVGLLARSWLDVYGDSFDWKLEYNNKWNIRKSIIDSGNKRMQALNGAISSNMGTLFQKVESSHPKINEDAIPNPWTLVQGYKYAKTNKSWGSGHSFIILDTHKLSDGTTKVLILEANAKKNPYVGEHKSPDGGPRINGVGHIDQLKNSYKPYSPGQAWWLNKDVPTWKTLKKRYKYRLLVRLKVRNMNWFM